MVIMILYTLGMHRCLKRWEIFLCVNVQIKDENMKGILGIKNHIWESFNCTRCLGSGYIIYIGRFQLAQKYNKPINKICKILFTNISWRKYSPDISYIFETSNISLHKYTQKMQHKNVLFIQEFSNWQFKHVQLLSYTVNHKIAIFWYARSSPLCFPFLSVKHYKYQHSAYI